MELEGTGTPGKAIIIKIINPEKTTSNTRIEVDRNTGTWKLSEPISIPLDAKFGEYTVTVSDGRNQILKNGMLKQIK